MDTKTIATTALIGALAFGGGTFVTPEGEFDTKGQDVKIQVMVKESNYHDAIYYSPAEWDAKTEQDINTEKNKRYTDWVKFVEEESKKDGSEVNIEINEIP